MSAADPLHSATHGPVRVRLNAGADSEPQCLAHFAPMPHQVEPEFFALPLRHLAGTPGELWLVDGAVDRWEESGIRAAQTGDLMLCEAVDQTHAPVADRAASIYRRLLQFIDRAGYPSIVKAWNYVEAINEGAGDAENYKRFCQGRAAALDEAFADRTPPAGTGVGGSPGSGIRVTLLCARDTPQVLENPRQVSAFQYPRQYGPRSPSFSRAALLRQKDHKLLFVSGTAAIVGHESRHHEDLKQQVQETLENWQALLNRLETPLDLESVFQGEGAFRVYLRHAQDLETMRGLLRGAGLPADRTMVLQADICRRELLFELDGIVPVS